MGRAPEHPARVLLVEDSRDDAELIEIALREAMPALECRRAWSADTLREALVAFPPQAVVSDFNLPGFSAAEALQQVRAHDPALPFVLLTGSAAADLPEPPPGTSAMLSKDELAKLPALLRELL